MHRLSAGVGISPFLSKLIFLNRHSVGLIIRILMRFGGESTVTRNRRVSIAKLNNMIYFSMIGRLKSNDLN
jgi:hypothetical protein